MKDRPFKIIKERLTFIKEFENMYSVWNQKGENLGALKYENVGRYKHWCWYQGDDVRMSPGCLQEVRDIQKKLISKPEKQG